MHVKQTLSETLDELVSSRLSLARHCKALDELEQLLARICSPESIDELNIFIELQNGFECNVASRIMYNISPVISTLQVATNSAAFEDTGDKALSSSRIIIQSLAILQGVALIHSPSKLFLSKKWCIQLFVDLLNISRYISTPPHSISNNAASSPTNTTNTLASGAIDTLLCVLVDSPAALRAFEQADGVEIVVKILKRTGVGRDIRIKCLEFLYFYLLDETSDVPSLKVSTCLAPSPSPDPTPFTPRKNHHLALFRKELDFVPVTPKKAQVNRLGVGTPRGGLRCTPKSGEIPPLPVSPTKRSSEKKLYVRSDEEDQVERRRSTQEKKEILSNLLGNVDALIEGVAKSGIWGLG
ncbi:cell division protein Cdc14 [Hysterangium stoloniferum]|nr:cell division protein Cdc14 [Hysterangium stoloniferum]